MTRPDPRRVSRLRQELRQSWERMGRLVEPLLGRHALVRGTLYERRRRCGQPRCRCAQGELHVSQAFCVSEGGKTKHRPLRHMDLDRLRASVDAYAQFRDARRDLRAAAQHMLALVDQLEHARCVPVNTFQIPPSR